MNWMERAVAGVAAREFLIVPPREPRYESSTYRARMEAALSEAMPGYAFTVTTEHPLRQAEQDIYVEPDGVVVDLEELVHRIMTALAPFVADQAPRLN